MLVLPFWQNYRQFSKLLSFQRLRVKEPARVSVSERMGAGV